MGEPRRNSRKGSMLSVSRSARALERDWLCYRGNWQPSRDLCDRTRRRIAEVREALDRLEATLP